MHCCDTYLGCCLEISYHTLRYTASAKTSCDSIMYVCRSISVSVHIPHIIYPNAHTQTQRFLETEKGEHGNVPRAETTLSPCLLKHGDK